MPGSSALAIPFWQVLLAALIIMLSGLAAYSNSFHDDFVLDDLPAIKENPTIQNGWIVPPPPTVRPTEVLEKFYQRLPAPLQPPNEGQTVTGRPLVNISFALNYDWAKSHQQDGFAPEGYHMVSLAIHLLAGLVLFGLVLRTLNLPKLREQFAGAALPVALMAALWWTLHPLQTESVTYLSQRAESLMGLFYLLALYCFVRGTQAKPWLWMTLAALSATIAGLCKEVTATLPLMILLYDWIFISEKFSDPFRRRWLAYAGLLLAMLPLAFFVRHAGDRGTSVVPLSKVLSDWKAWWMHVLGSHAPYTGLHQNVTWYDYAVAQYSAILHYLKLALWPHPLTLDYGDSADLSSQPLTTGNCLAMVAVMALVAGAIYLLWRKPKLGFLGVWFFAVLAPSSSVMPIVTEPAAEHRMYLPLAALAVGVALILWKFLRRLALPASLAIAIGLAALTFARNYDYRSGLELWRDTVAKHPNIARAHENYGIMLYESGHISESVPEYEAAERIKPNYPDCDNNLGNALGALGRNEEAVRYYLRAIPQLIRPRDQAIASYNLGNSLIAMHRYDDAIKAFNYSGAIGHYGPAFNNMGSVYAQQQKFDQAITSYFKALNFQPIYPQCETNLANTYAQLKQYDQSEQHYLRAIQEDPHYVDAHAQLGLLHATLNKYAEATEDFSVCIQLAPNLADAHYYYGFCLGKLGRYADAKREFETALKINPGYEAARTALAEMSTAPAAGK